MRGWLVDICRGLVGVLAVLAGTAAPATASAPQHALGPDNTLANRASTVQVLPRAPGTYVYMVNGRPQTMIGMGYTPIYRELSPADREAHYRRDFQMLHDAGVNTITGWDADKGYEQ